MLLGAGRGGRAATPVEPEFSATVQRFRLQFAPQEPSEFLPDALASLAASLTWDVGRRGWRFGPQVRVAAPFDALYTQAGQRVERAGWEGDHYRLTILGYWCEGDACGGGEELRANGPGVSLSPWLGVEYNRPQGWRLSVAGTAEVSLGAQGQWLAWGGRLAVSPARAQAAGADGGQVASTTAAREC